MPWPFNRDPRPHEATRAPSLTFRCNICGAMSSVSLDAMGREKRSCECGSTVRFRSIVELLSRALFDRGLVIADWPSSRDRRGVDLSGWPGYSERLASKVSYLNTFYDREPLLDITDPTGVEDGSLDFLISSDVFEHVEPPVSRAFQGARRLLKPGGLFLVTVPFVPGEVTLEHFPNLHDWSLTEDEQGSVLRNVTADGRPEEFRGLRFHGGEGAVLEMRVFTLASLVAELEASGFREVTPHPEAYLEHGIVWQAGEHVPVTALAP